MRKQIGTTFDEFVLWMVQEDNTLVFLCHKHLSKLERILPNRAYRDYEGWFKGPTCDAPLCCREAIYEYFPNVRVYE